jgi:acyl phosphate:glycerol-3-phosphate acyltransferase
MILSIIELIGISGIAIGLVGSYLCGSVPFGLILAQLFSKQDVREAGSGNIGATNVARVAGRKIGIITLGLDVFKGALPVLFIMTLPFSVENQNLLQPWAGLAAFCGHCFPIWLRFRGGKGVATGLGVLLALMPSAAAIGILCFSVTYGISRYVSLSSLVGTIGVMAGYFAFYSESINMVPLLIMWLILVLKHRTNLIRLIQKQEMRL